MSEHIYEERQFDAWHDYQTLNGQVDFETFMARKDEITFATSLVSRHENTLFRFGWC